jgi:hypothetical protein
MTMSVTFAGQPAEITSEMAAFLAMFGGAGEKVAVATEEKIENPDPVKPVEVKAEEPAKRRGRPPKVTPPTVAQPVQVIGVDEGDSGAEDIFSNEEPKTEQPVEHPTADDVIAAINKLAGHVGVDAVKDIMAPLRDKYAIKKFTDIKPEHRAEFIAAAKAKMPEGK